MRIGLFGGTFDPPHIGHLIACQSFVEQCSLDRCVVMPSWRSPHKESRPPLFSDHQRLELSRVAFCDLDSTEVSDWEVNQKSAVPTIATLNWLAATTTQADTLIFAIGYDQAMQLAQWRSPHELAARAHLALIPRLPYLRSQVESYLDALGIDFTVDWIESPIIELSSSNIRQRLSQNLSVRFMLTENVHQIVQRIYHEQQ